MSRLFPDGVLDLDLVPLGDFSRGDFDLEPLGDLGDLPDLGRSDLPVPGRSSGVGVAASLPDFSGEPGRSIGNC